MSISGNCLYLLLYIHAKPIETGRLVRVVGQGRFFVRALDFLK